MKFARVLRPTGEHDEGVVVGDTFISLGAFGDMGATRTVSELLADWDANLERLGTALGAARTLDDMDPVPLASCALLTPVVPKQVFQVALNYRDHAVEMGLPVPARPFVFVGLPTAISGANDPVHLSADSDQDDWELELGCVVKKDAYRVDPRDAADYIAGYVMVNDLTSRDLLHRAGYGRLDYLAAKNPPTFLPTGPFLVSAASIQPMELSMTLSVNDELMQDVTTADMIFSPSAVLASISSSVRLLAGDLILTGTPAGTGHARGRYLRDGDVISSHIRGLGTQRNVCEAQPSLSAAAPERT
ncbi:MAG: 2,4-didehydro-3-deoxy-L-rhamnonate hydrolase [Actinomycetota bacterium]|nr:2,4-didehydro-3-deoxy-L-rhamnonate hydrolase [Actinomycetota bacterium]